MVNCAIETTGRVHLQITGLDSRSGLDADQCVALVPCNGYAGVDPVQKVSTIPRGVAELGSTIQLIESVPSAFDILCSATMWSSTGRPKHS